MMRAVRRALGAVISSGDWRWMVPLSVYCGLMTHFFGWEGYCTALTIAVLLRHRIWALARCNPQSSKAPTA